MPQTTDQIEILDEDLLWRRVLDQPAWWARNEDGTIRPSSSSFKQRKVNERGEFEKGISVQLEKLTTLEKASSIIDSAGIAEIKVEFPRSLNLDVVYDPIINEEDESKNDLAHTLICPQTGNQITQSQAGKMARQAKMIVLPASVRD